jgi:hypothetical protein
MRNKYKKYLESFKKKGHFEDLDSGIKIILKLILNKQLPLASPTGFSSSRILSSG